MVPVGPAEGGHPQVLPRQAPKHLRVLSCSWLDSPFPAGLGSLRTELLPPRGPAEAPPQVVEGVRGIPGSGFPRFQRRVSRETSACRGSLSGDGVELAHSPLGSKPPLVFPRGVLSPTSPGGLFGKSSPRALCS